ncbi:MAG: hypothetical protein JXA67_00495 [Micromonosporaceae bacterium]|nr:hypothetical protein [Micromonosporaceae bacterium]
MTSSRRPPPNRLLQRARLRTPSPSGSGRPMSRQELADAVNAYVAQHDLAEATLDANQVGKLECGRRRWPGELRRAGFRHVLGAASDRDLGFHIVRGMWSAGTSESDSAILTGEPVASPDSGLRSDAPGEDGSDSQVVSWMQRRDLLATVAVLAFGDPDAGPLHDRLSALVRGIGAETSRRIGVADVERIEATTRAFRDWDNQWGGGVPRPAVLAQLRWVIDAGKHALITGGTTRTRLLAATADLAAVAAWTNYDVERHREARQLWMVAIDAAREAGDVGLVGHVLRQLAHQALHLHRPDEGLRLIQLAHATAADLDSTVADLAFAATASYESWCYAAMGRVRACERAISRAEDHLVAGVSADERPPWLSHFDHAELMALRGHTYHVLADAVPTAAAKARPLLMQAVAGRSVAYTRSRTLNLIALAAAWFQGDDDVDQGVRIGDDALAGVAALVSPRSMSRLQDLERVTRPHEKHPGVADLRARLRAAVHDTA